jgi:hypothetical protein
MAWYTFLVVDTTLQEMFSQDDLRWTSLCSHNGLFLSSNLMNYDCVSLTVHYICFVAPLHAHLTLMVGILFGTKELFPRGPLSTYQHPLQLDRKLTGEISARILQTPIGMTMTKKKISQTL